MLTLYIINYTNDVDAIIGRVSITHFTTNYSKSHYLLLKSTLSNCTNKNVKVKKFNCIASFVFFL